MIPLHPITEWREHAPWKTDAQVEQDLALSRAIVDLYSDPFLRKELVMRGGTALHKFFFDTPRRYSEDIDLVRAKHGPAKGMMDAIRERLSWLGTPSTDQKRGRITLVFRFRSESEPVVPLRLKVEINTIDGPAVMPLNVIPFQVNNAWFSGEAEVVTYQLEEVLGTKLRALYQRKKGRDLFDLHTALHAFPELEPKEIVRCMEHYLKLHDHRVTRAQFEANLAEKLTSRKFQEDMIPLLVGTETFDCRKAAGAVNTSLISLIPGTPWKRP